MNKELFTCPHCGSKNISSEDPKTPLSLLNKLLGKLMPSSYVPRSSWGTHYIKCEDCGQTMILNVM